MTTKANLYVDQGADFAIVLDLFSDAGDEFNIINQQFKCEVRKVFSSTIAFEAAISIDFNDNDPNNIQLSISANTTSDVEPGKYQYDIIMLSGTQRSKILEGLMFILPTITR
jgi:hypothetical protein